MVEPAPGSRPRRRDLRRALLSIGVAIVVVAGAFVVSRFALSSGSGTLVVTDDPRASASFLSYGKKRGQDVNSAGTPTGSTSPQRKTPSSSARPTTKPTVTKTPRRTATPKPSRKSTPPPEQGKTMCGASFMQEGGTFARAMGDADKRFGHLEAVRIFYSSPSKWPGAAGYTGRPVIVSLKLSPKDVIAGTHDAALSTWFRTAPRDRTTYWSLHHEPEDNLAAGQFTAAEYRKAWVHARALADRANNPRLRATLILMDWTLDSRSGRNWRDFYAGSDVIDVLGFDVYNHGWKTSPPRYYSAEKQLATIVATARQAGKPFGIAELGSVKLASDGSGTGRAAWIRDLTRYSIAHNALWVNYFDIDYDSDSDYRLRDSPSIQAWSAFCNS